MKKVEKKEDKLKIFDMLISSFLINKIQFKEWKFVYDMFLELLETEKIEILKIKVYANILISASVICYYVDDEKILKNEINRLKTFISLISKKDVTSNKNNNIEEIYKEIFILEQDIKIKKRNN